MSVKVKICGVRTPDLVETAVAAGADYIGVVFFEKSPRNVTLAEAALVTKAASGQIASVAVLVDPDDLLIEEVVAVAGPDLLQLHGSETPERMAEIKGRFGVPLIKAISVASAEDAAEADRFWDIADMILFDAKPDPAAGRPGGNGVAFNWHSLAALWQGRQFALSGGLTAENVGEAIRVTGATMVDVSSGVEGAPGRKDRDLVRKFIQAAKSTAAKPKAIAS
ncbi:MAG: phosphoribosylanthranilate isomerase [Methyloceanibacter sp.]